MGNTVATQRLRSLTEQLKRYLGDKLECLTGHCPVSLGKLAQLMFSEQWQEMLERLWH